MPLPLIIGAAAQLLDIILGATRKDPSTAPHFAPVVGQLITIASQAAGETEAETAARLANHDAIVKQYASAPPDGAAPLVKP